MSAHCYHPWKFGDEITDDFITVVADCCQYNYESGWGMGRWTPAALAILTTGDSFVWNVGKFIDNWDISKDLTESVTEALAESSDDENVRKQATEVLIRVVQLLDERGLLEAKRNPPPPREVKMPDNLSLPLVKRKYPKL